MKTALHTLALTFVLLMTLAQEAQSDPWDYHGKLLKQQFDTTHWREFYSDDTWRIRCIFVDMDRDGIEEMIAITTSEEDRMGDYWNIWKRTAQGAFRRVCFSGEVFFSCHWDSFYKIGFKNGSHSVIGLDMDAGYMDKERRSIVKPTPDCRFNLTPDGKYFLSEIVPDLDISFRSNNVVSIERLYPEWYFGFDFKPPPDVPHSVYTQRMPYTLPKGDLRHGGGIACPKDFDAFVVEYRRQVKIRTGKEAVVVYAVFLDAENDGDGDCFVSSDAELLQKGVFRWTLYLRQGERFSAGDQEVFPVAARKDLGSLPPVINAGKMAFCRVIRYDAAPTFLILGEQNKGKPMVRNVMLDYHSHSIEKLDCVEFGEDR